MSAPCHYQINVSENGKHLFSTEPGTMYSEETAMKAFSRIKERFTSDDGFQVDITYWNCVGMDITSGFVRKMLARTDKERNKCPRCNGEGIDMNAEEAAHVLCPVCDGEGVEV
jgi:hypothetical protein